MKHGEVSLKVCLVFVICRFRVAHTGVEVPYEVSVDGHVLTVVATDGYDVTPLNVDIILMSPGETVDFVISANQTAGKYWVRAAVMSATLEHEPFTPRKVRITTKFYIKIITINHGRLLKYIVVMRNTLCSRVQFSNL